MPTNGPKVFTVRKLLTFTPEQEQRAQRLAHKYGGSFNEVVRAGIAALEREHKRTTREIIENGYGPDGDKED